MESSRIRTLAEVVGVVAVVGSLVFVGLEIRQNAEATRAATVQEVTDGWREWSAATATNPEAVEALEGVLSHDDFAEADPVALRLAQQGVVTQLTILANAHYHYRQGLLPAEFWEANQRILGAGFGGSSRVADLWRWTWERVSGAYPEPFQELVDSILAR